MQPYGTNPQWTLPASTPPGTYYVRVYVRTSTGSNVDAQTGTPAFHITP